MAAAGFTWKGRPRLVVAERDVGEEADEHGQHVEDWQYLGDVWCAVTPVSGREFERAKQVADDVTLLAELRYSATTADLTAADRLRWVEDVAGERVCYLAEPPRNVDGQYRKLEAFAKETR